MKFLNTLAKKITAAVALVAVVAGVTSVAIAGFGPDRPTKAWSPGVDGFDHVTFNSFTGVGNGVGDERDFLRGSIVGTQGAWSDPVNSVPDQAEVEVKVYIHNGADARLNDQPGNPGVAKDVNVRVAVPVGSSQAKDITSYVSASNASPREIFDTVSLTGANGGYFELTPVAGSAKLYTNGVPSAVSDAIFTTGVNIADQKGCFEYVREVTFRVKVKMPNYSISKQVKVHGQGAWAENISAQPTDTLSWMITFNNIGYTELKNVKIVDNIPTNLTVVPGSVKLTNGNYPNGYTYPDTAIQANGRQVNVDIGNYGPGIIGYVTFRTTIAPLTSLSCGENKFINEAYATPTGYGAIRDIATATTNKHCEVIVVKECVSLVATKINRTKFDFVATARAENATIQDYVFTAKDKNGATVDTKTVTTGATTANYTFERSQVGEYTVSAVINTDKGVATGTCEQKVKVDEEPKTPTYVCNDVKIDILSGRKVKVTVTASGSPANRVSIKNYEYNYGDGKTPLVTDKNVTEYTYDKDGTYKVSVKVTFVVDGVNQTVSGDACAEVVTFTSTPEEKCPYNNTLAKNDPKCVKPTELPNTGAGSMVGLFGAITAAGMFISRRAALRK